MDGWESSGALASRVTRLEGERVAWLAREVAGVAGAAEGRAACEDALEEGMDALERLGVLCPLHMVGARYQLEEAEMRVLTLALLPELAPALAAEVGALFGEAGGAGARLRLSHALPLMPPSVADLEALRAALEARTLVQHRLVRLSGERDAELVPSPAVLELLGLG